MQLDIWSDPVCPWCYLGYARLLQAIAEAGANPFTVAWKPFQLNPDMPKSGIARNEYLLGKFGDQAKIDALHDRIAIMGREAGIEMNFARITRAPNTLDAHRLIYWAGLEGCADAVAEGLFARNFRDGGDISDPAELEAVAVNAGMKPGMAARLLATEADRNTVAGESERGLAMGVTGVPLFVLDAKYALSGAQDTNTWRDVITEVMAKAS